MKPLRLYPIIPGFLLTAELFVQVQGTGQPIVFSKTKPGNNFIVFARNSCGSLAMNGSITVSSSYPCC